MKKFKMMLIVLLLCLNIVFVYANNDSCLDSDGGFDFYKKGEISGNFRNKDYFLDKKDRKDICINNNVLEEFYCSENYLSAEKIQCIGGCIDGECTTTANKPDLIVKDIKFISEGTYIGNLDQKEYKATNMIVSEICNIGNAKAFPTVKVGKMGSEEDEIIEDGFGSIITKIIVDGKESTFGHGKDIISVDECIDATFSLKDLKNAKSNVSVTVIADSGIYDSDKNKIDEISETNNSLSKTIEINFNGTDVDENDELECVESKIYEIKDGHCSALFKNPCEVNVSDGKYFKDLFDCSIESEKRKTNETLSDGFTCGNTSLWIFRNNICSSYMNGKEVDPCFFNATKKDGYFMTKTDCEIYNKGNIISIPSAGFEDEVITNFSSYDSPFSDIEINDLEGVSSVELYRRGIIGGYKDGTFKGHNFVNRAEIAKFLLLARYGGSLNKVNNGKFSDVKEGEWYVEFVVEAEEKGIINGYPDGSYRPGNTVNMVEFLKMISLTFGLNEDLNHTFKDIEKGVWFEKYIGIIEKYNMFPNIGYNLNPSEKLTRNDISVAIYQFFKNR